MRKINYSDELTYNRVSLQIKALTKCYNSLLANKI